ncbi:MAG: hypothetical protein AB3N15_01525 [Paracoccaceae bacterium]
MQDRLSATGLLAAWEAGANRRPLDRALAILWAAGAGGEDPAGLSLAERDRRLLALRRRCFGPVLHGRTSCPGCGAELETEIEADQLIDALPVGTGETPRALNSRDLAAVADLPAERVASALSARLAPGEEPSEALDRQVEAQASAVVLKTDLTCADCGTSWSEVLDVVDHVWASVEQAATGLLREVAELAMRYGWSEAEILALSPARRSAYLSLARQG